MAKNPSIVGRALSAFSRLSDSEKRLVTLLALVLSAFALVGVGLLVNAQISKREKAVRLRAETLNTMEQMREPYEQASTAEKRTQSKLRTNTTPLLSLVKEALVELALTVPDLQEKRAAVKDSDVTESSVDVNVREISVDRLQALIERLEGRRGDTAVKITKLKAKTRFDNPEMLEVTMTVTTWKGASAEPSAEKAPGAKP